MALTYTEIKLLVFSPKQIGKISEKTIFFQRIREVWKNLRNLNFNTPEVNGICRKIMKK